jgi:hypothetical protein
MSGVIGQIEQYAERCLHLAYQCEDQQARRFLRMLAADLTLEAERRRKHQKTAYTSEFAELTRLSRQLATALTRESASTT